jgi:CheY-like chemotaxis protein
LELICRFLERLGYKPDVAVNGSEVIEQVMRASYEIILMDVRMPELDGVDVTSRIRKRESLESLPKTYIIAVTAFAMTGDRKNCLDAGMDDYMSKPIEITLLQKALVRGYKEIHS